MNYRHAFHAGNHADVLKHAVLLACLDRLAQKPAPFAVLDAHAGIGRYDLNGEEAARSPEWRDGIEKLWNWPYAPALLAPLIAAVQAQNTDAGLRFYPGSPLLSAARLRPQDRLVLCELHPQDFETLRANIRSVSNAELHRRDAWEALTALLPPKEKRGLVLIDPPYEEPGELAKAASAIRASLKRFGHGMYLWWRPLKSASELNRADSELRAEGLKSWLRADLWVDAPEPTGKLVGSSVFLINPPYGLRAQAEEALPQLAAKLALSPRSGWRLDGAE